MAARKAPAKATIPRVRKTQPKKQRPGKKTSPAVEPRAPEIVSVSEAAFNTLYGADAARERSDLLERWHAEFTRRKSLESQWDERLQALQRQFSQDHVRSSTAAQVKSTVPERIARWWKQQKQELVNQLLWNRKLPSGAPAAHGEWAPFVLSWFGRHVLALKIGRLFTYEEAKILADMLNCSDAKFGDYVDALKKDPAKWVKFFGE